MAFNRAALRAAFFALVPVAPSLTFRFFRIAFMLATYADGSQAPNECFTF